MLTAPSADFTRALYDSHLARVRLATYSRDAAGDRTFLLDLPFVDGTLTVDGSAIQWRTLRATVANEVVRADGTTVGDLIDAYATDIIVWYGIQTDWDWDADAAGASVEWVKVATLRVEKVVRDQYGATLTLEAGDDAGRLREYPIEPGWPSLADDDLDRVLLDGIQYLVNACYPDAAPPTWVVDGSVDDTQTWSEQSVFQGDRVVAVKDMADALGAWVRVGVGGNWLVDPLPTASTTADWTFDVGEQSTTATLSRLSKDDDRDDIYNAVRLRYELPFAGSFVVEATDDDPASPTYYDGAFGKKPKTIDNDLVDTEANAQAACDALLEQYRGIGRVLTVGGVYNPLLEPGDTVAVRLGDGTLEKHLVDRIELPLNPGEMTLTTRVVATE